MFALSAPLPTFPGAPAPQGAASEAAVAADPFAALLAIFDGEGGAGQDGFQEDAQDPAAATPDTVLTAAVTAPLPPAPILLSLAVTSEAEPGAGSPASASAMPEAFVAKAPQATPLVTPAPASAQ